MNYILEKGALAQFTFKSNMDIGVVLIELDEKHIFNENKVRIYNDPYQEDGVQKPIMIEVGSGARIFTYDYKIDVINLMSFATD
jgi:hypothetical protein